MHIIIYTRTYRCVCIKMEMQANKGCSSITRIK